MKNEIFLFFLMDKKFQAVIVLKSRSTASVIHIRTAIDYVILSITQLTKKKKKREKKDERVQITSNTDDQDTVKGESSVLFITIIRWGGGRGGGGRY